SKIRRRKSIEIGAIEPSLAEPGKPKQLPENNDPLRKSEVRCSRGLSARPAPLPLPGAKGLASSSAGRAARAGRRSDVLAPSCCLPCPRTGVNLRLAGRAGMRAEAAVRIRDHVTLGLGHGDPELIAAEMVGAAPLCAAWRGPHFDWQGQCCQDRNCCIP